MYLTHLFPIHPSSTPWKHQKTQHGFLMFSGGRERVHWEKMCKYRLYYTNSQSDIYFNNTVSHYDVCKFCISWLFWRFIVEVNIFSSKRVKCNKRNTRRSCEICSKLRIRTSNEVVFIANSEKIADIFLVFLLLTLNR